MCLIKTTGSPIPGRGVFYIRFFLLRFPFEKNILFNRHIQPNDKGEIALWSLGSVHIF